LGLAPETAEIFLLIIKKGGGNERKDSKRVTLYTTNAVALQRRILISHKTPHKNLKNHKQFAAI
jgi:hypothetical protein